MKIKTRNKRLKYMLFLKVDPDLLRKNINSMNIPSKKGNSRLNFDWEAIHSKKIQAEENEIRVNGQQVSFTEFDMID